MSINPHNHSDTLHLATATPHVGACGQTTTAASLAHGLTSDRGRVTCSACLAVDGEAVRREKRAAAVQMRWQKYQAGKVNG